MGRKKEKIHIKKNLIRRLNLLMLLLNQPQGQSKTEIFKKIPEYSLETSAQREKNSRDRTFVRDKEELAAAGFSVRVDSEHKYYVNYDEIFCNALNLDEKQRRVLRKISFLWQDGALKVAIHGALLKLGIIPEETESTSPVMFSYGDDKIFTVFEALNAKKAISFNYHAAAAKDNAPFTIEVWGIIGRYGQWYLHAFDVRDKNLKFFRLDRIIGAIQIKDDRPYSIPAYYQPRDAAGDIRFPGEEKYCVIVGDPKYLEAVPLPEASVEEYPFNVTDKNPYARLPTNAHYKAFGYNSTDDAAARLIPFLDAVEVLYPQQLKEEIVSVARRSLQFQESVNADTRLNDKHSKQIHKDRIPDLLRVFGIAMLNTRGMRAGYGALLKYLGIEEAQLHNDLRTLNYIENLVDATIDFGYVDVDEISQERELLGAAGASVQGILQPTRRQTVALLFSLEALRDYVTPEDRETIDCLRNKFADAARIDRSVPLKIYVPAVSLAADKENIILMRKAIEEDKNLRMDYLDGAKTSYRGRAVKPLKTYSIDGRWYIQAWCYERREKRNFRCDRMKGLKILEEAESRKMGLSFVAAGIIDVVGGAEPFGNAFSQDDGTHRIVAALNQDDDRFIKDYFVRRIKNYENHPLANKVVQVTIKDSDYFARFLVSLGGRIAILSPVEETQRCQEYALKIIDLYGKRTS